GRGGSGVVIVRYPKATQSIRAIATPTSLHPPGTVALSADGFLGSGAVSFSLVSGGSCSVAGSTLTVSGVGRCMVRAQIAADHLYAGAVSPSVAVDGVAPPPPASPPSAPYIVEGRAGNGAVALRLARPDSEGTSPVREYRVYSPGGGLVCSLLPDRAPWPGCTVKGLTNGRGYEFFAVAVNEVGESLPSRRVVVTPVAQLPSPPKFIEVRSGHREGTLSWGASPDDGGSPVTEYRLYEARGDSPWFAPACTVPASSGPPYACTRTGLTNGTQYRYYVTAVSAAGESGRSEYATLKPAMVPPSKPRNLAATFAWGTLTLTWDPPDDSGTLPITSYEVMLDWSLRHRAQIVKWGEPTAISYVGLAPGSIFTPLVRARSDVGWGPYAVARVAITIPRPVDPKIGYPEIRRDRQDPDLVTVTGGTEGIRPGTRLYVWVNRGNAEDFNGWESSQQGATQPVIAEDGTFSWTRRARMSSIWEVIWCTGPNKTGVCSPWMLLVDPTM
ncbi:MAG: fibronectin type III domain-containing protein, partial [Chloroflexota bacterium]